MSSFHLHARLLTGTLKDPIRNELQTAESDDRAELERLAVELAISGFTVWLYEHGPLPTANGEGAYRVIREWRPK